MMTNGKIGAAVVGGYMLGRTRKAKLAMGLAMALAGSRVRPGELGRQLARSPFLSQVNQQVRDELAGAGKAAAATVLNAKADRLAEALHQRTENLREQAQGGGGRVPHGGDRDAGDRSGEDRGERGRARDEERGGRGPDDAGGGSGEGRSGPGDRPPDADRTRRPGDG
ncbi:ABC transporter substrate-binding protein [Streptomyces sp. NPDC095602]|uniref:ABC transporter substrate-binding protein n=1 Tax=Streptomyces sp. NPDC095602 TaxID=3155819 RepID=UPI00331FA824